MFNLLVAGSGWADTRDTLPLDQVIEYTDQEVAAKFQGDGALNRSALISLPALFMAESSDQGDPVARVGTITRARVNGREIVLDYIYDPTVPPLTNNRIKSLSQ